MDKAKLQLRMIEKIRMEMYSLAAKHGLSSSEVIAASQKLDRALNEYNRMLGLYDVQKLMKNV